MHRPSEKTRRRPTRSAVEPESMSRLAITTVYASMIHCSPETDAWKSRPIEGSATFTIVPSRLTISSAEQRMARISRRRRRVSSSPARAPGGESGGLPRCVLTRGTLSAAARPPSAILARPSEGMGRSACAEEAGSMIAEWVADPSGTDELRAPEGNEDRSGRSGRVRELDPPHRNPPVGDSTAARRGARPPTPVAHTAIELPAGRD